MEVAGVALAVPGALALVFKCFAEFHALYTEYRGLDKRLNGILSRLSIEEQMFRVTAGELLKGLPSEEWWEALERGEEPDERVKRLIAAALGDDLCELIRESIEHTTQSLRDIQEDLRDYFPVSSIGSPPAVSSPIHMLALQAIRISLSGRLGSSALAATPLSRLHKARILSRSVYKKLLSHLEDLRRHNKDLMRCLQLKDIRTSSGSRENRHARPSSTIPETTSPQIVSTSPVPTCGALTGLYRTLAEVSGCSCHALHLELDVRLSHDPPGIAVSAVFTPAAAIDVGQLNNDSDRSNYRLLIAEYRGNSSAPRFTFRPCENLCRAIAQSQCNAVQTPYMLGELFHIQTVPASFDTSTAPETPVSLQTLLRNLDDAYRITTYDRLTLSAKLSRAAVTFFPSPWIKDWSPTTIEFFASYESSNIVARWKPHCLARAVLGEEHESTPNELYERLASLLLQIGGADIQNVGPLHQAPPALEEALWTVTMEMGRQYKKIAEYFLECLRDGHRWESLSERGLCVMQDFGPQIQKLEKYAQEFEI